MSNDYLKERVRVGNMYYKESGVLEYIQEHPKWYNCDQRKVELFNMTNLTYADNTNVSHSHWDYNKETSTLKFKATRDGESVVNMRIENMDMVSPVKGSVWSDDKLYADGTLHNNTFFIQRELGLLFVVLDCFGTIT